MLTGYPQSVQLAACRFFNKLLNHITAAADSLVVSARRGCGTFLEGKSLIFASVGTRAYQLHKLLTASRSKWYLISAEAGLLKHVPRIKEKRTHHCHHNRLAIRSSSCPPKSQALRLLQPVPTHR